MLNAARNRSFGLVLGLTLAWLLLTPQQTPAHGLGYALLDAAPAVALQFAYSTGDPLAYGAIKIYAPDNHKVEYQNGRTDASGCFSFVPNAAGLWRIVLTDGQGHALEAEIPVEPPANPAAVPAEAAKTHTAAGLPALPIWLKAVLGLSLFLNIYGAYYLLARKKRAAMR